MTALLTICLIAVTLLAWVSVFNIIPNCSTSRFRYRVWRIRDSLVDDLRAGTFTIREQPEHLVNLFETAIEEAGDVSALNAGLMHLSTRRQEIDFPFQFDEFPEAEATKLKQYFG